MRDTAYRVLQAKEKLMGSTQKEPTVEEIAKELDIPREEVVFALDAIVAPVSLYEPIYSDSGDAICVVDQVSDTKNTDESWLEQIALKDAIGHLTDRERRILTMRFCEGKTQMEVSDEVGISQAQVSRLEKTLLNRSKRSVIRMRSALPDLDSAVFLLHCTKDGRKDTLRLERETENP